MTELIEASIKYVPGSEEGNQVRLNRVKEEKELTDFLNGKTNRL
jgi:hypothetical protein